eukprot:40645-Chlamydomonas_euryale.AAC.3
MRATLASPRWSRCAMRASKPRLACAPHSRRRVEAAQQRSGMHARTHTHTCTGLCSPPSMPPQPLTPFHTPNATCLTSGKSTRVVIFSRCVRVKQKRLRCTTSTSGKCHRSSFLSASTWSLHCGQYQLSSSLSCSGCRNASKHSPSETAARPWRDTRSAATWLSCCAGLSSSDRSWRRPPTGAGSGQSTMSTLEGRGKRGGDRSTVSFLQGDEWDGAREQPTASMLQGLGRGGE